MRDCLIRRRDVMEILDNERAMSEDEKFEATNDKDRAYNSGEIQCTKRVWHRVVKIPAVDAVPVVRCKDCCYFVQDGESLYCTYHDNINVTEKFFCATGEVKHADARKPV